MRNVTIQMVSNGYIVAVGCKTFVYTDIETLIVDLRAYSTDPAGFEKLMLADCANEKKLGKMREVHVPVPVPEPANVPTPWDLANGVNRAERTER